jgi:hypothetical protein
MTDPDAYIWNIEVNVRRKDMVSLKDTKLKWKSLLSIVGHRVVHDDRCGTKCRPGESRGFRWKREEWIYKRCRRAARVFAVI